MPGKVNKVMAKFLSFCTVFVICIIQGKIANQKDFIHNIGNKNLNGHNIDNQALEIVIRNKAIKVCKTCLLKLESDWFSCICLFILKRSL